MKQPSQKAFAALPLLNSAQQKATTWQGVIAPLSCVHKICVWGVDKHVDEGSIALSTAVPYTLPIR